MPENPHHNQILVTGGCGFIGANLAPMLEQRGYTIEVLENLSKGSKEFLSGCVADIRVGDIRDRSAVAVVEKEEKEKQPGSVMFFSGIRIIEPGPLSSPDVESKIASALEEGREEGREDERRVMISQAHKAGMTSKAIAEIFSLDVDKVEKLLEEGDDEWRVGRGEVCVISRP